MSISISIVAGGRPPFTGVLRIRVPPHGTPHRAASYAHLASSQSRSSRPVWSAPLHSWQGLSVVPQASFRRG
jgi:hypothetical protein